MKTTSTFDRWARFRFLVVGRLLAAPPAPAQLRGELVRLAQTPWPHPMTGEPRRFAVSTIERWYYAARSAGDPIAALGRKPRRDRGRFVAISARLAQAIHAQYRQHPSWSVTLHRDNLEILVETDESLGSLPSYSTLRRYMARHALKKLRRQKGLRAGEVRAREQLEAREVRSYEAEHVQGLWHLDFHHGSRKIPTSSGEWLRPILLAVLDDRSRLICHAQWFLDETAESLIHGLVQAILKRGLPRALLTDNGSAMLAGETTEGLTRLSILHRTTLPYSPHQNGKQEVFWAQVEGRLIAMLEGEPELSLSLLNRATLAWVEREYHQSAHSEPARRRSRGGLPDRVSAAHRRRSTSCASLSPPARSASKDAVTARSASPAGASRSPIASGTCAGSRCASPAGICAGSGSSTSTQAPSSLA